MFLSRDTVPWIIGFTHLSKAFVSGTSLGSPNDRWMSQQTQCVHTRSLEQILARRCVVPVKSKFAASEKI